MPLDRRMYRSSAHSLLEDARCCVCLQTRSDCVIPPTRLVSACSGNFFEQLRAGLYQTWHGFGHFRGGAASGRVSAKFRPASAMFKRFRPHSGGSTHLDRFRPNLTSSTKFGAWLAFVAVRHGLGWFDQIWGLGTAWATSGPISTRTPSARRHDSRLASTPCLPALTPSASWHRQQESIMHSSSSWEGAPAWCRGSGCAAATLFPCKPSEEAAE